MRDVRLVKLSEDGTHLVLTHEPTGEQFALRVEDQLRTAVLSDRSRNAQLQLDLDSRLRPKEIQARLRGGESSAAIAEAAGVPLERVMRYAGPVLAEREHIAEQARRSAVRHRIGERAGEQAGPGRILDEMITARLAADGVAAEAIRWDAWRTDEGRWAVSVAYPGPQGEGAERLASFVFDPLGRMVVPTDDLARWLTGDPEVSDPNRESDLGNSGLDESGPDESGPDESDLGGEPASGEDSHEVGAGRGARSRRSGSSRFRLAAVPSDLGEQIEADFAGDVSGPGDRAGEQDVEDPARGRVGQAEESQAEESQAEEDTVELSRNGLGGRTQAGTARVRSEPSRGSRESGRESRRKRGQPRRGVPGRAGHALDPDEVADLDTADPEGSSPAAANQEGANPGGVSSEGVGRDEADPDQAAQGSGGAAAAADGDRPARQQRSGRGRGGRRAAVPSWDEILFGRGGNSGS